MNSHLSEEQIVNETNQSIKGYPICPKLNEQIISEDALLLNTIKHTNDIKYKINTITSYKDYLKDYKPYSELEKQIINKVD
jgi:hypothetical protein